jgi:hypothetical protein
VGRGVKVDVLGAGVELLGRERRDNFNMDGRAGANKKSLSSSVVDNLTEGSSDDGRRKIDTRGSLLSGTLNMRKVGMTLERGRWGEGGAQVEHVKGQERDDLVMDRIER